MKSWREIAVPHPDVLEGTFQQSEFAADISAVRNGKATREYQDPAAFFQRTFITHGMRLLLTQVAQRLNGTGGEPVIQLQTAFGGGKTHTMLAVYHLASRPCALKDLAGIPALLDHVGLLDVPHARVAVIDGTNLSPGQPWSHGQTEVKTLWGELAWQLGEETDREPSMEVFPLNTAGSYGAEIDSVCKDNELVVPEWSPFHLRSKLRELYWKNGTVAVRAATVWEDMQRYFYMPRLRRRGVLEQAIVKGAASRDFFGTAYGQTGDRFDGFKLGDPNVQFDDTLLLIDPEAAASYEAARKKSAPPPPLGDPPPAQPQASEPTTRVEVRGAVDVKGRRQEQQSLFTAQTAKAKAFFGSVEVNATTAKMKLVDIADEIINVLAADPNATVKVTVEITAEFPDGASDQTKRAVSENAAALRFKNRSWE